MDEEGCKAINIASITSIAAGSGRILQGETCDETLYYRTGNYSADGYIFSIEDSIPFLFGL